MANDCIDLLESIALSCVAQDQVGGVKKKIYVTQKQQIESYTADSDGYINTLVMGAKTASEDYKLITVTGKKHTHSGKFTGVIGANINLVKQDAIVKIFTETPAQREAVLKLFKADELVVFFETENEKIEIYGLDKGLEASAMEGGTGVQLQDDTGITLTLSGEQTKLPEYFLVGGSLATSIAYLDAISETV